MNSRNLRLLALLLVVDSLSARAEIFGGVDFPSGPISFVDRVISYQPNFGRGPAPIETQQDAKQILGVPEQGEMSLGSGGRITLEFVDNSVTGNGNAGKDLYIFEIGGPETVDVEVSRDGSEWHPVGSATGFAAGIDLDRYGFGAQDRFYFVRLTDRGTSRGGLAGADLVAVGAASSGPPSPLAAKEIKYTIQAHVGGRSRLIIQGSSLQWHHLVGPAPGLGRQLWNFGSAAMSPTIVDSNLGPNIPWVPDNWQPTVLGNGTHAESFSPRLESLTPVLPPEERQWILRKKWGDGRVRIVQQPINGNSYTLILEFDDLQSGSVGNLSGDGFYAIELFSGLSAFSQLSTKQYSEVLQIGDINNDGTPDTAGLLGRDVTVLDTTTGSWLKRLHFFWRTWEVKAMAVLDSNSDGNLELAALGKNFENQRIAVQLKDVQTGEQTGWIRFFARQNVTPIDLTVADVDFDGTPEIGVMASREDGRVSVEYRNSVTGESLPDRASSQIWFPPAN